MVTWQGQFGYAVLLLLQHLRCALVCCLLESIFRQPRLLALGKGLLGQVMPRAHCQSLCDIFAAESLPLGCLILAFGLLT